MRKFLSKFMCVAVALAAMLCSAFSAAASEQALGDVDGDNTISVKDATRLQMHLAGLVTLDSAAKTAGDVNQNGTVDISDVTCLQKYAARIILSFDEIDETTRVTEQITTEQPTTAQPTTESPYDSEGYNNIVVKP